jgi:hypothetical protein
LLKSLLNLLRKNYRKTPEVLRGNHEKFLASVFGAQNWLRLIIELLRYYCSRFLRVPKIEDKRSQSSEKDILGSGAWSIVYGCKNIQRVAGF